MIARFLREEDGSPAAEFALLVPMLVVLLFGGFESGNFMWSQHKLIEGARQGARYASRLPIESFCEGTRPATSSVADNARRAIQVLTATGQLPDAQGEPVTKPRVGNWDPDDVEVTPDCAGFTASGIYTQLGHEGPVVVVSTGTVAYDSLFNGLGTIDNTFGLSARSSSAVIGI